MEYRALRFEADQPEPTRCRLSADSPTSFSHGTAGARPSAFVLRNDDIEALVGAATSGLFNDRGRKHPAKGLAKLLVGRDPIALIRGSYSHPGQLARSVRTLLVHAERAGEREVYLIGADAAPFEALWATGRAEPRVRSGHPARDGDSGPPGPDEAGLLELLEPIEVPAELTGRFVGHSRQAQLVRQLVLRAARSAEPVLILGSTGTGKEVVARSIHDFGDRRTEPFIAVNCAGIPADLLESELFGHERGAFTGALHKKPGLWKIAGRGTLFLDEIGDLTNGHQAKLLRALQEGHVRPLGATGEVRVRARILAATNRDLYAMVRAGDFREDLYYRLRAFMIETPSLQEHPEDIPTLATWFWRQVTDRPAANLPPRLVDVLADRPWPGNARELRAVLASLHALFGADDLDLGRLGAVLRTHGYDLGGPPPRRVEVRMDRVRERRGLLRIEDAIRATRATLAPLRRPRPGSGQVARVADALRRQIAELREISASGEAALRLTGPCDAMLDALREDLVDLAAEVEVDLGGARRRLRNDVEPGFGAILDCVRRRVESTDPG